MVQKELSIEEQIAIRAKQIKAKVLSEKEQKQNNGGSQKSVSNGNPQYVKKKIKKSEVDFKGNFVLFDVETTGFSSSSDKLIQVSAIKCVNYEVVEVLDEMINPEILIPEHITELTGITNQMVQNKPTISQVMPKILDFIGTDVVLAYNAPFDVKFIKANAERNGYTFKPKQVLDVLLYARTFIKSSSHKLENLKQLLKLDKFSSHNALDDCLVTLEVYKYCKKVYNSQG